MGHFGLLFSYLSWLCVNFVVVHLKTKISLNTYVLKNGSFLLLIGIHLTIIAPKEEELKAYLLISKKHSCLVKILLKTLKIFQRNNLFQTSYIIPNFTI